MASRSERLTKVRELLSTREVHSQEELAAILLRAGIETTQATLSRDLRELAVLKGSGGYRLPESLAGGPRPDANGRDSGGRELGGRESRKIAAGSVAPELQQAVRMYCVSARQAASIVVVRTGPGQAGVMALAIDRLLDRGSAVPAVLDGAVGTVAGDDTVFIACASEAKAKRLTSAVTGYLGVPAA
jgi:transcriptional regulator of arginine metabolism